MSSMRWIFVAILFVAAGAAQADPIPLDLAVTVDGVTTIFDDIYVEVGDDGRFEGRGQIDGDGYSLDWELDGNTDPVLAFAIGVADFGAPSTFGFLFGTPTVPIDAPSIAGGSIGGSITDTNGDGATISTVGGDPLYTASVNFGGPFQTLHDAPFSFSTLAPSTTRDLPVASFGLPGLTTPGPALTVTFMTIGVTFGLSGGGDTAAISGNFILEPGRVVPEPATVTLTGLCLTGLALRGLRRKRAYRA